jgi:hypothetical protein
VEVRQALLAEGHHVEILDDYFQGEAPDADWLTYVGKNGLTKDLGIRYRIPARVAIAQAGAAVFVLKAKNAGSIEMAAIFKRAMRRMIHLWKSEPRPCLCKVTRPARVDIWLDHRELLSLL